VAFRAAYLIVRDNEEASDVAQEAFIRAYRSLRGFDARQPFRPWLLRIVTNLALNSVRGARRRQAVGERYDRAVEQTMNIPSPERAAEAQELSRRVSEALRGLNAQDRALLYLRYFIGASESETATAIGRPAGTVKSRLHRALRKLRTIIREQYPDLLPSTPAAEESGGRR